MIRERENLIEDFENELDFNLELRTGKDLIMFQEINTQDLIGCPLTSLMITIRV